MSTTASAPLDRDRLRRLPLSELAALARGRKSPTAEPLPKAPADQAPLSFAQERLWFMSQIAPDSPFYNMPFRLELEGPLDTGALAAAFDDVIQRHEPLRTVFPGSLEAGGEQRILQSLRLPLPVIDLASLTPAERDAAVERAMAEEAGLPFDLEKGPMLRARLLRLSAQSHLMVCSFHHIAFDGWSIGLFNRDLFAAYEARAAGRAPALPPAGRYADFALWQRERASRPKAAESLEWWSGRLAEFPPLSPRGDYMRPPVQSFRGAAHDFHLPASIGEAIDRLARASGATANMVALAAFNATMGRYENTERFVIGTSVAGRDHPATEAMIGFFVNNLMIRADLSGDPSFAELIAATRAELLAALDHQDVPFQQLVTALAPERDPSRNPLYQVAFTYQNAPMAAPVAGGLRLAIRPVPVKGTHMDLELFVSPGADGLVCQILYATDLFRSETIAMIASAFGHFLEAALAAPETPVSRLPLASPEATLAYASIATPPSPPGTAVLWDRLSQPTTSRLLSSSGTLLATHEALLAHAERIDAALTAMGVADSEVIALLLDQGPDLLASFLACLRRGSLSLQLDPLLPDEAVSERLAQAGIGTIVTRRAIPGPRTLHPDNLPQAGIPAPRPGTDPDQAVILIMTSGSTGTPKLPALTQKAILNRLDWATRTIPPAPGERAILKTSPAFVDSIAEALQPLADGFDAIVPDPDEARTPSALLALIHRQAPTRLVLTPSFLRALIDLDDRPWPIRQLTLSGEPLPADLLKQLRPRLAPDAIVLNIYGSAEVTADVTAARLDLDNIDSDMPIGRPLPGARIWLLDHNRRPVPPGAVGVMHVEGVCLAKGYHGDPALTRQSFHDWTTPDGEAVTLFDTGDLARRRPDGQLVHLGRRDAQIKLRGIRIEPAEIETRIRELPGVKAAVVTLHKDSQLNPRLVAYIQPEASEGDRQARTAHWQEVYDQAYRELDQEVLDDFRIWQSAIDGEPIPLADMYGWTEASLDLVREARPRSVVEIGCGQGLLLGRLAQDCAAYLGTDISAVAIERVRGLIERNPALAHVGLARLAADQPLPKDLVPEGGFDVAMINSVVQYLPSAAYLLDMLDRLLPDMAEGGRIVLGDLRSLHLQRLLAIEILLARVEPELDRQAILRRLNLQLSHEPELLLDPRFFLGLGQRQPRITAIEARPKPNPHDNELTRYRYDVILHLDHEPESWTPPWREWAGPDALNAALEASPELVAIRQIPHARLARAAQADRLLDRAETANAGQWRALLAERLDQASATRRGMTPAELGACGAAHGYDVQIQLDLSGDPSTFQALFTRPGAPARQLRFLPGKAAGPAPEHASQPYQPGGNSLKEEVRAHLRRYLPPAFVPDHLLMINAWPLSPSGKIVKHRLPPPETEAGDRKRAGTEAEKTVAAIWREVLGIEHPGIDQNFFEAGGNSLLLAEVHHRLARAAGRKLALVELFRNPTIRAQALLIGAGEAPRTGAAQAGLERARLRRARG